MESPPRRHRSSASSAVFTSTAHSSRLKNREVTRQSFAAPPYEELKSVNWADADRGAAVTSCTSQVDSCRASNVLVSNDRIWLSEETLPQSVTVSLEGVNRNSSEVIIRTIGWHCWHSYTTNPQSVVVSVSVEHSSVTGTPSAAGATRALRCSAVCPSL
jgi:hypothetical protein